MTVQKENATGHPRNSMPKLPWTQKIFLPKGLLAAAPAVVYAIVSAVVLRPLLQKRGYPFSFDMSFGPHMKVPPEAYGLGSEFGRRLPDFIWISLISRVIPAEFVAKGVLLLIPFAAGTTGYWASRRLLGRAGLTTGGAIYAGLLYELNPFVYQRFLAGHWHILLGYAFFPTILVAAMELVMSEAGSGRQKHAEPEKPKSKHRCSALWPVTLSSAILGITSFAVSVMGLLALLLAIGVAGASRWTNGRGEREGGKKEWGGWKGWSASLRPKAVLSVAAAAVWSSANATWIIPALLKSGKRAEFSDLDWRAFLVRGHDQWEAFLNVVRLVGFYRQDFFPPTLSRLSGWLASAAVVALFIAGLVVVYRHDPRLFAFALLSPVTFLFLALGERAPLVGPLLGWVYPRIPGWQIFRESQKLLVPVCFFYAALGGLGVSRIASFWATSDSGTKAGSSPEFSSGVGRLSGRLSPEGLALLLAALTIPVALSADLFFGLRGSISVSPYPSGWYEAAEALPSGDGKLLVFPWHQHLPFDFTGGRTNVNPVQDFFPKEVLQSTRAEFPGFVLGVSDPVDSYVRDFIASGPVLSDTASALRPLGVDSVVVLKTADWLAYEFLERKAGITKIIDNHDLRLYVVNGSGGSVSAFRPTSELPRVQESTGVASDDPELLSAGCQANPDEKVSKETPFSYRVPGPGCWVVPQPFDAGWRARGVVGEVWSGAAVGVFVERESRVVFVPAFFALGGHLVTATTIMASLAVLLGRRRQRAL